MKYQLSDYEKNLKNKMAIVCPDSCGPSVFLTAEFFKNDQEFAFWKTVSDDDYRFREKEDRREKTHTVSLSVLPEAIAARSSAEAALLLETDVVAERLRLYKVIATLRTVLTPPQLRRFWLCVVCGCSRSELAAREGVSSSAVVKSIRQARHRITASGLF